MPLRFERDSYARCIILESSEVRQFQEEKYHERLDAEVEQQVAADLEYAELRLLQWENERRAALAGIAELSPAEVNERVDRFTEANRQLDYWQALAELA